MEISQCYVKIQLVSSPIANIYTGNKKDDHRLLKQTFETI